MFFCLEIILGSQGAIKLAQRGPVYPLIFPGVTNGYHITPVQYQNQETEVGPMQVPFYGRSLSSDFSGMNAQNGTAGLYGKSVFNF